MLILGCVFAICVGLFRLRSWFCNSVALFLGAERVSLNYYLLVATCYGCVICLCVFVGSSIWDCYLGCFVWNSCAALELVDFFCLLLFGWLASFLFLV